ncbi:hypothetical protein [Cyclobacterium marinum]|uniref:hypothetical protein n=1 Tax=Cyclobacterium marinum TaxID=104 RepID=UPI0030DC44F5
MTASINGFFSPFSSPLINKSPNGIRAVLMALGLIRLLPSPRSRISMGWFDLLIRGGAGIFTCVLCS